ncbi:hypothetical protein Gpo141_00013564, partial [Globisporangium polare]
MSSNQQEQALDATTTATPVAPLEVKVQLSPATHHQHALGSVASSPLHPHGRRPTHDEHQQQQQQHQSPIHQYDYNEALPHTKYADDIMTTEPHTKYADDIVTPPHGGTRYRRTGIGSTTYVVRSPVRSAGQTTTVHTSTVRSPVRSPVVRTTTVQSGSGSRHATPTKGNMQFVQHEQHEQQQQQQGGAKTNGSSQVQGVHGQVRADGQEGEVQYYDYDYESEAQGQQQAAGGVNTATTTTIIDGESVSSGAISTGAVVLEGGAAVVAGQAGAGSSSSIGSTTYVVRSPVRPAGQTTTVHTSTVRSPVRSPV